MFLCKLKISFYFASVLCMYVRYDDDVLFLFCFVVAFDAVSIVVSFIESDGK